MKPHSPTSADAPHAWLFASGDLRLSANQAGWPAQHTLEVRLEEEFAQLGWELRRAHPYLPEVGHGFLDSQRAGIEAFRGIPRNAPIVVAEAVWQYSHHVLAGLISHKGPILTVANFTGEWPGLVGMLNLNGSLTKAGVNYSTLWSEHLDDSWFRKQLETWVTTGQIRYDEHHISRFTPSRRTACEIGQHLADTLREDKAIIGVFDEGCMGMYNAIFDDRQLNAMGIFKERLSQSALYAEMLTVGETEIHAIRAWLAHQGMTFRIGSDAATELTEQQIDQQLAMYVAALRIADDFGVDAIGIQYQQGLKDLVAASDLAEGLLNDPNRPPVHSRDGTSILWENQALPHFNEVDEGCAVDALVTHRVWNAYHVDPSTTLHDIRWGAEYNGEFVWVFEISGAVPPSHLTGGYAGAEGWRQNPVYFPLGGSTIRGISRPGRIVWSRVYLVNEEVHADLGLGRAVELPAAESNRRWAATNPEWPMMHAVLDGIDRNSLMARHKANHIQVAYVPEESAVDMLEAKAACFERLGMQTWICGVTLDPPAEA